MIRWLKEVLGIPAQKQSATIAKERLMVIVAHERGNHELQPDFLPLLEKELTEVIAKYVKIDRSQVQVEFEQKGGRSVLELNVTLPEQQLRAGMKPSAPVAAPQSAAPVAAPKAVAKPAARTTTKAKTTQKTGTTAKPKAKPKSKSKVTAKGS